MFYSLFFTIAQIKVGGLEEAAQLGPLFGVLVSIILVLCGVIILLYNQKQNQSSAYSKDIQNLNKEHNDKIEDLRYEETRRDDERNRIWRESEKETLNVLNGVTGILEMGEKMKINDTQRLLDAIKDLKSEIKNLKK